MFVFKATETNHLLTSSVPFIRSCSCFSISSSAFLSSSYIANQSSSASGSSVTLQVLCPNPLHLGRWNSRAFHLQHVIGNKINFRVFWIRTGGKIYIFGGHSCLTIAFDIKKAKETFLFALGYWMLVTKAKNDRRTPQIISLFDVTSPQAPSTRSCGCKDELWRAIKNRGFKQTQKFLRYFTQKNMEILLS